MNIILLALKQHGTMIQVLLFLTVILLVWFIELNKTMISLRSKWSHSSVNLLFVISALPIQLLLSLIVIFISGWTSISHWGILYLMPFSGSIFIKYIFGFFLLDFFEYLYHVVMHKVGPLWNFHLIHHSDEQIDVSTTLREHPVETFVRVSFLTLWVFISGASIGLLLLRQTIQTISNLTAHSSYRLPVKLERIGNLLFITPGLHHVHHHFKLPYTDRNYGDVLSIWDRLFGTYKEMQPDQIQFGVDKYKDHLDHSTVCFKDLIRFPFLKKKVK